MHFLPDVYVQCDVCKGKRYNRETLEVKFRDHSISDVLDMTIEAGAELFKAVPSIAEKLETLKRVGLGYISIGQQATTLSGGEAQRVKLSKELSRRATGRTLYILDEPTTGLHFHDVKKLLEVLQELVDQGNTVVVIEHNLEVIKTADWIVDLGPEGGDGGGEIVASGTPEEVAKSRALLYRPVSQAAAEERARAQKTEGGGIASDRDVQRRARPSARARPKRWRRQQSPITSGEKKKLSPQVSGRIWRACIMAAITCSVGVAAAGGGGAFLPRPNSSSTENTQQRQEQRQQHAQQPPEISRRQRPGPAQHRRRLAHRDGRQQQPERAPPASRRRPPAPASSRRRRLARGRATAHPPSRRYWQRSRTIMAPMNSKPTKPQKARNSRHSSGPKAKWIRAGAVRAPSASCTTPTHITRIEQQRRHHIAQHHQQRRPHGAALPLASASMKSL